MELQMKMRKFLQQISIVFVLMTLASACGLRVGQPEATNLWSEKPLVDSLPTVTPEKNSYLFQYDTSVPFGIQELNTWQEYGATWIDLQYNSPRGGTVPATLVVPDGKGPFAGIVMMHGGAYSSKRQDEYWRAAAYAKLGAVIILIDAPFARPEAQAEHRRYGPLTWTERDRDEQIQLIMDLQRAVDLLAARPDVDPDRMAYVGNSFGGAVGGLLAGVETRLKAYALSLGDGGWVTHYTRPEAVHAYPAGPYFTVSEDGQQRWLDAMWPIEPIHYVSLAAPAALLFQNGIRDVNVPARDALRYQAAGSQPKRIIWYDAPHALPYQAYQDQIMWLLRYIGTGKVLGFLTLIPSFRASGQFSSQLVLVWLFLILLSTGIMGWVRFKEQQTKSLTCNKVLVLCWFAPVVLLGPLGLATYFIIKQNRESQLCAGVSRIWRTAFGITTGAVLLVTAGVITALAILLGNSANPPSIGIQLAANFGLPFMLNLILWVLLRRAGTVRKPILSAVVSTSAVLAGINLIMVVLQQRWFPFGASLLYPELWVAVFLSAVVGFITGFPLHLWLAFRHMPAHPGSVIQDGSENPGWVETAAAIIISLAMWVFAICASLLISSDIPMNVIFQAIFSGG
jgi:hypothetical protein